MKLFQKYKDSTCIHSGKQFGANQGEEEESGSGSSHWAAVCLFIALIRLDMLFLSYTKKPPIRSFPIR